MVSNRFLSVAIAVILLPTIALATDYIVGDGKGWTTNFNYQDWAKDKMFMVGDVLVFNYEAGNHDVVKVNGSAFKDCSPPPGAENFTSGNDKIELKATGNKWYLCSKSGHCNTGQKLSITVMDMAPQPAPNSAVRGIIFPGFQLFIVAFVFLMGINVV
ncbi:hypothetical protein UlMin_006954 [Ulmus minor]